MGRRESRLRELDLRADEHDGKGDEQHPADREGRDKRERKRRVYPVEDRAFELALAAGAEHQQPERQRRIAAPSTTYGQGATSSSSGAKRPTASAPAVAASAVRHHASQVRSAAMEVRCHTSTCAGVGAGDSGSVTASGWAMRAVYGRPASCRVRGPLC